MCNQTEDVFRKWTDHAMAKRKDKQWPTLRYTENTNPIRKNPGIMHTSAPEGYSVASVLMASVWLLSIKVLLQVVKD